MIGVFDSGLGGLTGLSSLTELLPQADIIYFGDTGRVPYGTRSANTIIKYTNEILSFLKKKGATAALAACGTVSSVALPVIEKDPEFPLFGVLTPAADAAAKKTRNGIIGVLATGATVKSGAFDRELNRINKDIKVISSPANLLVPIVENGFISKDNEIARLSVREYIKPIKDAGADTVILGCTHFPLLSDIIAEELPKVTLINSGKEAAKALAAILPEEEKQGSGSIEIYVSDSPYNFENIAEMFLGHKLTAAPKMVKLSN